MEQSEKFSDDLQENLRIENEFLKIKLKAQYGEAFQMESNAGIPPEIENRFLKSMIAFEDEYAEAEYVTIYERIGKPGYRQLNEMSASELNIAVKGLSEMLAQNDIELDICDGPYPDALIYKFITEELFDFEVEKQPVAGMTSHFVYEEFHPNHRADILKCTHAFMKNWFNRKFTEFSTELSWHCVTADGAQMTREDVIDRTNIFFDSFPQFKDNRYNIADVSFELQEETLGGMGFSEGLLKYDAEMENGDIIHYEGPFKLYLQLEDNWWSIFYFVMPGFKW